MYSCQSCDYKTNWKLSLVRHVDFIHKGKGYQCESCDFKAARNSCVKKHEDTVHKGVRFVCELCSYKATTRTNVARHCKKNGHEVRNGEIVKIFSLIK